MKPPSQETERALACAPALRERLAALVARRLPPGAPAPIVTLAPRPSATRFEWTCALPPDLPADEAQPLLAALHAILDADPDYGEEDILAVPRKGATTPALTGVYDARGALRRHILDGAPLPSGGPGAAPPPSSAPVLHAYTIHPPFAWAIMHGIKREEMRHRWPRPLSGRLAIHIGRSRQWDWEEFAAEVAPDCARLGIEVPTMAVLTRHAGKIIGVCDYDCPDAADGPDPCGACAIRLRHPVWLRRFLPCRGQLNLWRLPSAVAADIAAQLASGRCPPGGEAADG